MTCQEFEELSGAYVLDAVTPDERREAEAHLTGCARCTRLLRELQSVVAFLPLSVPQINPADSLKERILSAIRQESLDISTLSTQRVQSIQTTQRRSARRQIWTIRLLAVAAVLLFVLLGGMTGWNF